MNDESQSRPDSNFEALEYPGGKKEDEEFGNSSILADTRRRYNAQDEFVHLLYNDIAKNLRTEWRETDLQKSVSIGNFLEASSRENDGPDSTEKSECVEKSFAKDPQLYNWKLSSPDEYVEVKFPMKNIYVGHVSRRQMEGVGTYRWASGEIYKGEFERNLIQGTGRFEWKDHSWYEGEFNEGYRHGTGNFFSREYRRFYIGQWHMGRKQGNGYCRYGKDDDFYEGNWRMDQKHGTGFRVYENGTRYVGQWENDQRHGVGTMVWPNGDVYRGEWKNGTMNGYGEYVWKGFFNKSLSWPQENSYMGEWLNGMRHGRGDLKLNSTGGAKYSGNWYMDKKHGHGMIIGNSGAVTEADPLFLDDVLLPLGTDASDFLKPDSELAARDSKEQLGEHESSHHSAATKIQIERKEPRRTTVFDPLQFPSLSYHVQRLLKPKEYPKKSPAVSISSGKCRVCASESECACLYDHLGNSDNKFTDTPETTKTMSFDMDNSLYSYDQFCENKEKTQAVGNSKTRITEKQYEEHWVHNCLKTHMPQLRKVYKLYGELYCSKKDNHPNLSMGKIALWQLMRDTGINKRGISLIQFERYIAKNRSAFIEAEFYPFERIEFFQFIHTLLEISWHLYTKFDDIETEFMRGRLAGGLHRLLVREIYPNAGKLIGNVSTTYRDLQPMYSVYRLYCDLGEPHTAKQFLKATCTSKGTIDPKPSIFPKREAKSIPRYLINGTNVISVGERLTYIPLDDRIMKTCSPESSRTSNDDLARELFALRHLGAEKMLSIMADICPAIKDEETDTIINMDYELTFLEFYEILLESTKIILIMKKLSARKFQASEIESQTNYQSVESFTRLKEFSLNNSNIKKTRKLT